MFKVIKKNIQANGIHFSHPESLPCMQSKVQDFELSLLKRRSKTDLIFDGSLLFGMPHTHSIGDINGHRQHIIYCVSYPA